MPVATNASKQCVNLWEKVSNLPKKNVTILPSICDNSTPRRPFSGRPRKKCVSSKSAPNHYVRCPKVTSFHKIVNMGVNRDFFVLIALYNRFLDMIQTQLVCQTISFLLLQLFIASIFPNFPHFSSKVSSPVKNFLIYSTGRPRKKCVSSKSAPNYHVRCPKVISSQKVVEMS